MGVRGEGGWVCEGRWRAAQDPLCVSPRRSTLVGNELFVFGGGDGRQAYGELNSGTPNTSSTWPFFIKDLVPEFRCAVAGTRTARSS